MKAQGLPMNTIVLGILSLLVLVLLAAAFVPSFRNFFTGTSKIGQQAAASDEEINLFRSNCQMWCSQLNGLTQDEMKESPYCTRYITVETSPGNYMADHCYTETGDKVHFSCTAVDDSGTQVTVDSTFCSS